MTLVQKILIALLIAEKFEQWPTRTFVQDSCHRRARHWKDFYYKTIRPSIFQPTLQSYYWG